MAKSNGSKITSAELARLDVLAGHYVRVRNRLNELKEEYERACEPFKTVREQLVARMLAFLDATGLEMARTSEGTISAIIKHTASCSDPDEFMKFVADHNLYELVDRKPNATACREWADENGALPPGVRINSMRTISVRSPQS